MFNQNQTAINVRLQKDTLTVENCSFLQNDALAGDGGAINISYPGGTIIIKSCSFSQNSASDGGSIHLGIWKTPLYLYMCNFSGDIASSEGGSVYISGGCFATLKNCTFANDSSGGGGAVHIEGSNKDSTIFENCTFNNNKSAGSGGAVSGNGKFVSCLFNGNWSFSSGIVFNGSTGASVFEDCIFKNSTTSSTNSGKYILYGGLSLSFKQCTFAGNPSIYNQGNSLVIFDACTFVDNGGPGVWSLLSLFRDAKVINCVFKNNSCNNASNNGLIKIYSYPSTTKEITGCVFFNNTGLAVYSEGSAVLKNNTIVGDSTLLSVGNIYNSIIWSEKGKPFDGTFVPSVHWSCVNDSAVANNGGHNIFANPLFRNILLGNLHLTTRSPCLDAALGDSAPPLDAEGMVRHDMPLITNTGSGTPPFADMGAYEVTPGSLGFAPEIISASIDTTWPESLFTYLAEAIDADNDPVTISFPGLPAWLSVSGNTISGRIKKDTRDTLVTIVASDGKLSDTLVLQIHNPLFCNQTDGTWTIYDTTNGLPANAITCLAVSGTSVWAGTYKGLAMMNNGAWSVYTTQNCSIPSNSVTALCPDIKNGGMLVGSSGYASRCKNGVWQNTKLYVDNLKSSDLYLGFPVCIAQTAAGTNYIGGFGSPGGSGDTYGLATANPPDKCYIHQSWPSGRTLYRVTASAALPDGGIWLSGPIVAVGMVFVEHQYYFIDKTNTWTSYTSSISSQTEITELEYNTKTGVLWRGEEQGVTKGTVKLDTLADLRQPYVTALAFDSAGNTWVGTNYGLVVLFKGGPKSKRYVCYDGLPALPITAIETTSDGLIWIGTTNGLVSLHYTGDPIIHDQTAAKRLAALTCFVNGRYVVFSRVVPRGSTLRIFTLSGRQIAVLPVIGRTAAFPFSFGSGLFVWQLVEKGIVIRGKLFFR
jgi:hypothetical protein